MKVIEFASQDPTGTVKVGWVRLFFSDVYVTFLSLS